ncbi:glutaredoxin family protein [Specibacter sp. AOP5-B1-6]|uniref:glutaredoxin family protein n=1 Tax=Specibacter sp. AOP5-B1-6 TaxID=3457653 RepID=UPI00402BB56F
MEPAANNPVTRNTAAPAAPAAPADPAESPADGAAGPKTGAGEPLLELVTRAGCHLCDDARAVVTEVAGALGMSWSEVSIDDDPELSARFGEEVPVVLVDGVQRDFWHIDPNRLRSVLGRALAGQ